MITETLESHAIHLLIATNHMYRFYGKMYKQADGGPIGTSYHRLLQE